jgi:hypothetical protein
MAMTVSDAEGEQGAAAVLRQNASDKKEAAGKGQRHRLACQNQVLVPWPIVVPRSYAGDPLFECAELTNVPTAAKNFHS